MFKYRALNQQIFLAILTILIALGFQVDTSFAETPHGREAAQDYFKARKKQTSRATAAVGAPHYLAIHAGGFFDGEVHKWGDDNDGNKNNGTFGVTYRVGEWTSSMDLLFRGDILTYNLNEGKATKLSLLPMITFPDVNSGFPLYFGGGIGLGVFLKQISGEGELSLDYQLVAGVRTFDVFESLGLMFEVGLKNHFHLLSDGQIQGYFFAIGTVFAF